MESVDHFKGKFFFNFFFVCVNVHMSAEASYPPGAIVISGCNSPDVGGRH